MSLPACAVCGSVSIQDVFSAESWLDTSRREKSPLHKFAAVMAQNEFFGIKRICKCKGCGFCFADPYPAAQDLGRFYQEYYANRDYSAKLEKKIKRARRRILKLNKAGKYKNFLDVGCNVGTAVQAAHLCGLAASGVEIDKESVTMAQDLFPQNEYVTTSVQDFSRSGRRFDIIYTTEVIEHLQDVNSFMEAIHKLLSPQGVLYLTTPDAGHFRTPKDLRHWHEMKLPEHISLFTKQSLSILLDRHGFTGTKFQRNWKPGIRLTARKAV